MNRQSLSGILALSSDIWVDVPSTAIPSAFIAMSISAGLSSSPSRASAATGRGVLLQEAMKMHALASASATVGCRLFIAPALPIR